MCIFYNKKKKEKEMLKLIFRNFWKAGSYIQRVRIESDGETLYEGHGRRVDMKEYGSMELEYFTVERGLLIVSLIPKTEGGEE